MSLLFQAELTRGQLDELLLSLLTDCVAKEGGTEDDMGHVMARELPETRTQKCIAACMGESIGLVNILCSIQCRDVDSFSCNKLFFSPADGRFKA